MIASNIICRGASRFLNTAYFQDVSISGTATLSSLSLSGNLSVTGTSTLSGNTTVGGTLGVTGAATFNNWITTANNYGWKSAQGGGWYMTDANYIRSYNKPVLMGHNMYFGTAGDTGYYVKTTGAAKFASVVAPSGSIATLNSDNVSVSNNLHAAHFDLQTVAQLGGSFYVSPTVKFPNSGTSLTVAKSGTTLTLTITDSSITSTTMAGIVWSANSRVKVSGTINGVVTGTMDGTISSINTGSHTLTLSVSGENSGSVVAGTYSASQFSDLSVMVYQRRDGSNDYRVGIWMNCYDLVNSSSTIRIYGGSSASPNVMLGNLSNAGLGTVNNLTPEGWGLFAQNAFLHGKVVANGGLIGNWNIGTTGMYYNSDAPSSTSITMIPGGTTASSTSIGGSSGSKQWIFTGKDKFGVDINGVLYANSAVVSGTLTAGANSKIGPWNVTTTSIYKVSNTLGSTSSGAAYFGDLGLSVGNKFKVDANGVATLGLSTGYHATMDTDSFDVLNGSTMLATFGETATIGNMSARGVSIDANGFKFNNGGQQNFFIGVNNRSGDTITSATATVTKSSTTKTIDNIVYYRAASISSTQTVISVVGHLESAIENGEPIVSNAEFENVKSWVVDGGYLWVEDGFSTYSSFEESITYTYVASNTSNLPYMVLGISAYDNDSIPGVISFAQGYKNKATGSFSTALGASTVASGKGSFSCGSGTIASGNWSLACGINTIASGLCSHSEGQGATASGRYSHAEGELTTASGYSSHSEGINTIASGVYSHSEGYGAIASGADSHAEGELTTASGEDSHSEGTNSTASGGGSHSEGWHTTASGYSSHSEGRSTIASGNYSHSEGSSTIASGNYSHSSGTQTTASGQSSYSEGWGTAAIGTASHAEGQYTTASGDYSHVGGYYTVSLHNYQFVIGKYNKATVSGSGTEASPYTYTNVGDYPFIIGKGTSNSTAGRSNAFTVDWSGNVVASGSLAGTGATLTGALTGTSASFSSTISATGATLTGALSGTSASFTGDVLANKLIGASATLTGALTGTSATFSGNVTANKCIGAQNVLWSGAWYMGDGQTATLSESALDQSSGIVLVWSYYNPTTQTTGDWNWNFHFIPKKQIELHNGGGSNFMVACSNYEYVGTKFLYVGDTQISGHQNNYGIYTASGISFQNNRFVLRYVIGV